MCSMEAMVQCVNNFNATTEISSAIVAIIAIIATIATVSMLL